MPNLNIANEEQRETAGQVRLLHNAVYLQKALIDRWERANHELRCAVDAIRSYMTEFYNG